jgi:hypothetical protein
VFSSARIDEPTLEAQKTILTISQEMMILALSEMTGSFTGAAKQRKFLLIKLYKLWEFVYW